MSRKNWHLIDTMRRFAYIVGSFYTRIANGTGVHSQDEMNETLIFYIDQELINFMSIEKIDKVFFPSAYSIHCK